DRRRLAGTVGSEEPVHLPRLDLQVEPVQRTGAAEGLDHSLDCDRRCVAHRFVLSGPSGPSVAVASTRSISWLKAPSSASPWAYNSRTGRRYGARPAGPVPVSRKSTPSRR